MCPRLWPCGSEREIPCKRLENIRFMLMSFEWSKKVQCLTIMMARCWGILIAWGFTYFWDMWEMLDTRGLERGEEGTLYYCQSMAFHKVGCGSPLVLLGWVHCREAVDPDPQLCAGTICILLHCSSFLLCWVSSWFLEPVFGGNLLSHPTWLLCPPTVVPLSNPSHPTWPSHGATAIQWHLASSQDTCGPLYHSGPQNSADCQMCLTCSPSSSIPFIP